jgi:threonine synthase
MLSCRICEATHPLAPLSSCDVCSGPLDVRYVWDGSHGVLDDPRSLWSRDALLPHRDTAIPGPTPLVPAPRISAALDIDVHMKLESANPTHSFKDRMAASALAAAQGFGIETLFCASTGNLGAAVAAGCAAAGLEGVILSPADTEEPELPAATYGASVFKVRGTFEDCRRLERELEHLFPWGFLEGNLHAFAVEGIKTIAYEIAEQLRWETPAAVVSPVASGTLFAKIAQGFVELADHGVVVDGPPRMYGAQPSGCPPVAGRTAAVAGDAEHRRPLAGGGRSELRRARDRRRPDVRRLDHRAAGGADRVEHRAAGGELGRPRRSGRGRRIRDARRTRPLRGNRVGRASRPHCQR